MWYWLVLVRNIAKAFTDSKPTSKSCGAQAGPPLALTAQFRFALRLLQLRLHAVHLLQCAGLAGRRRRIQVGGVQRVGQLAALRQTAQQAIVQRWRRFGRGTGAAGADANGTAERSGMERTHARTHDNGRGRGRDHTHTHTQTKRGGGRRSNHRHTSETERLERCGADVCWCVRACDANSELN